MSDVCCRLGMQMDAWVQNKVIAPFCPFCLLISLQLYRMQTCTAQAVGHAAVHGHTHSLVAAGGVVVLAEQFSHDIYRKSLARLFEVDEHGHLQMYFNATFDVIVSKVRNYQLP